MLVIADDEWRLPTKQAGTAADWALWSKMPTAEILSAVVLSLGIEPLKLSTRPRFTEAESRYNRLGPKFRSRYALACANVSKTGPLHPVGPAVMVNGRGGATVSLPEFGAWAIGIGWELPERFPRPADAAKPTALEPPAAEPAPVVAAHQTLPATLPAPAAQAVSRFAAQERAVLQYLASRRVSPTALPRNDAGKPGIKAEAKKALQGTSLFVGSEIFRKAWERLRATGEIQDRS